MGGGDEGRRSSRVATAIVCDASPLIALAQIGRLLLLPERFGSVIVPPAVVHETARSVGHPVWLVERDLDRPVESRVLASRLDAGESEALSLALEMNVSWVALDERRGRRLAHELGFTVVGTLGILRLAKERGFLVAIRPEIDQLLAWGFHLAPEVLTRLLAAADESD